MAEQEQPSVTERGVILHEGSLLETIGTRALAISESQEDSRLFLPEDVVSSRYGVLGFLVVDKSPEQRWVSYITGEWTGVSVSQDDFYERPSHYNNTDGGFKMVRYFVLPEKITEFFAQDKFLGEPMIDKCFREATLPEEFDEDLAEPQQVFGTARYKDSAELLINSIIQTVNPHLSEDDIGYYQYGQHQRSYLSFHPWQDFKFVIQEGQRSVFSALQNMDLLLVRFDENKTLPVKDFELPQETLPALPEATSED